MYLGWFMLNLVLVNAAMQSVGSYWIHRALEEFASKKGKELLKESLGHETYEGIGHVVLGYPYMEALEPLPRKEDYIHFVIKSLLFSLFGNVF